MEIGLVSCTKRKRDAPAIPRNLYDASVLFRKASRYCETHHDDWYVLSAKHHLLAPDGPPIEPYDDSLTDAGVAERRTWADTVVDQLDAAGLLAPGRTLAIHAGKAYYGELLPRLDGEPVDVTIPTEGLRYGETLAWYDEHT